MDPTDTRHERRVQISYRIHTANVSYHPARLLDPDLRSDLRQAIATEDIKLNAQLLDRTVTSWDVVKGGQPVEITNGDSILNLPYRLILAITDGIERDFIALQPGDQHQ
jgi:hypothetical protein